MAIGKLKMLLSFALRDVLRSKIIFSLTILSLSVIFVAILLTGGILQGFDDSLSSTQIDAMGHLAILPPGDERAIENPDMIKEALRKIPNVQSFAERSNSDVVVKYGDVIIGPYFNKGVDINNEKTVSKLAQRMIAGRFLEDGDTKEVVIGSNLADALVDLEYDNKRIPVGEYITLTSPRGNVRKYKVVGILDAKTFFSNWVVFMTTKELKSFNDINDVSQIVVKLSDPSKLEEAKLAIENKNFPVEVQTWRQQAGFITDILVALGFITNSILSLLMIAVFVITSVIIYINFFQSRRQVGILKSMGASNGFVMGIYMVEAFIFATLSFGFSLGVFALVNRHSNQNPIPLMIGDFHTIFDVNDLLLTLAVLLLAAVAGSIIPARLAARTNIADVVRDN